MSIAVPEQPWEPFGGVNHVSNFSRSTVAALSELSVRGWMESAKAAGNLSPALDAYILFHTLKVMLFSQSGQ